MTSTTQTASDIARVFALQQDHQWTVKASTVAQRREKLARLKAAVEAHADDIVVDKVLTAA
jgi:aldehyde dehydrogenase (NAD+)